MAVYLDYESFLSKVAKLRNPSPLRTLYDRIQGPCIIFSSGLPNPEMFPIKSGTLELSDGSEVKVTEEDMQVAQQYGSTIGHPEMVKFVKDLIKRLHDPPTMDNQAHKGAFSMIMTTGSQHAIYEAFCTLINEGDTVLTTCETYPALLDVIRPLGANIIGVKTDRDGIVMEDLRNILSKWPKPDDNRPSRGTLKALYCVPNGDNPTGARLSVERKQEVYRLARDYNFLIVEDDAYYMLEQRPFTESFLSMDEDGRVLRLDTFSKTFAPGLRLGVLSGPQPLVEKALYQAQCSTQGCSSISQVMFLQVARKWGVDGYLEYCERLNKFYQDRRLKCEALARKYLKDKAVWDSPTGGMFLWIRLVGIKDTYNFVLDRLIGKRKLLVAPGEDFKVDRSSNEYIRISYSFLSEEETEKAFQIIAEELDLYMSEQSE